MFIHDPPSYDAQVRDLAQELDAALRSDAVMPYALERRPWCGSMVSPGSIVKALPGWILPVK